MTVLEVVTGNTDPGEERLNGAWHGWVQCMEVAEKSHLYPSAELRTLQTWHLPIWKASPLLSGTCGTNATPARLQGWDLLSKMYTVKPWLRLLRSMTAWIQQYKGILCTAPSYKPHPEETCGVISKEKKFREGKKERKVCEHRGTERLCLPSHSHITTVNPAQSLYPLLHPFCIPVAPAAKAGLCPQGPRRPRLSKALRHSAQELGRPGTSIITLAPEMGWSGCSCSGSRGSGDPKAVPWQGTEPASGTAL